MKTATVRRLEPAKSIDVITEDSVALMFRERYAGQLLFDHDMKTWFVWDGQRWKHDKTTLAFEFARQLARELTLTQSPKSRMTANKVSFANGVERFGRSDRMFAVDASV